MKNIHTLFIFVLFAAFSIPTTAEAQRAYIYTDSRGNTYAAMDASDLTYSENRAENPDFQVEVPLYTYSEKGDASTPITDAGGKQVYVKRTYRHYCDKNIGSVLTPNRKVSSHFLIAPADIDPDGNPYSGTPSSMTWANANGYLATANTAAPEIPQSAVEKGCSMYRGKDGQDAPGTWRMPTQRETILMYIFAGYYETENSQSGFRAFYRPGYGAIVASGGYWTATESSEKEAWYGKSYSPFDQPAFTCQSGVLSNKFDNKRFVRCIRDLPPVK